MQIAFWRVATVIALHIQQHCYARQLPIGNCIVPALEEGNLDLPTSHASDTAFPKI